MSDGNRRALFDRGHVTIEGKGLSGIRAAQQRGPGSGQGRGKGGGNIPPGLLAQALGLIGSSPSAPSQPSQSDAMIRIFDTTLGSAAASIDTGANGIPSAYPAILILMTLHTEDAAAAGTVNCRFNGDTAANYDDPFLLLNSGAVSGGEIAAATSIGLGAHATQASSNYVQASQILIPNYAGTTFWKLGTIVAARADGTTTNAQMVSAGFGWRSTAAINQFSAAGATANLSAGSRVTIYGLN